jgi:Ca2+-binding RTX toxin-like protein
VGDAGYDALLDIGVDQGTFSVDKDTLNNIENIVGTAFNDTLVGKAGANIIEGGFGRDILTGGRGVDTFVYEAPTQGQDIITDFGGNDIFNISASGFGSGLTAGVALSMSAPEAGVFGSSDGVFVSDANPMPTGTSANFLYNTNTGILSFDHDGTGLDAAVVIATLNGVPSLNINQFTITA